ncbi:MAG: amino acid racemase [Clostridia bacterium]|nr:amino acid racemase [Oscillospiraceae bacterium]MBQ2911098.1 amino acid racemase [Clostridia bacterium]MBQ6934574.1 amino acid racemase [Clostridia bacterium]MBQ7086838.1 amino acid racemase [Clostridia bacterium]MBQ7094653.1 amino acid racemase [Clostridia bacterium]
MKKVLGVLGGMGPLATADFFTKVVNLTKASCDGDHIHILIDNYPQIKDRTDYIVNDGEDPLPQMIEGVRRLMIMGAEVIAMPCNTAHYFAPAIEEITGCEFIHILKVNAKAGRERYGTDKKVGILATTGVLQSGVYARAFADEGVDCIFPLPDQQQKLLKFIYDVKAGIYPRDINEFTDILDSMLERGAHYFVLGCTELPLISEYFGLDKKYELLDSTLEQARAAVLACGYELKGSVSYDEE